MVYYSPYKSKTKTSKTTKLPSHVKVWISWEIGACLERRYNL